MLEHSEPLAQIAEALAAAQAAFGPILKDKTAEIQSQRTGKSFSYAYVDLATIMDAVRPHLGANGLAVVQDTALENGAVQITTLVLHKSGEWLKGTLAMPCDTSDPRSVGIGATYGRRYHLQGMLGIAAETDTDAEGAGKSKSASTSTRTETGEVGEEDLCPVHKVAWKHHVGTHAEDHKTKAGQPYDFWSCPGRLDDGSYCKQRPPQGYGTPKTAADVPAGAEGAETKPGEADYVASLMKTIEAAIPKDNDRLTKIREWCLANNVPPPLTIKHVPKLGVDVLTAITDSLGPQDQAEGDEVPPPPEAE